MNRNSEKCSGSVSSTDGVFIWILSLYILIDAVTSHGLLLCCSRLASLATEPRNSSRSRRQSMCCGLSAPLYSGRLTDLNAYRSGGCSDSPNKCPCWNSVRADADVTGFEESRVARCGKSALETRCGKSANQPQTAIYNNSRLTTERMSLCDVDVTMEASQAQGHLRASRAPLEFHDGLKLLCFSVATLKPLMLIMVNRG